MAKDYAKYVSTAKRAVPRKRGLLDLLLVVILVLLIAALVYGAYIRRHPNVTRGVDQITDLFRHKKTVSPAVIPLPKKEPTEMATDVHFDFYNELPNQQIEPARANKNSEQVAADDHILSTLSNKMPIPTVAPIQTAKENYFLQLGVFKNEKGATQLRLSLLLSGIDADVVKTVAGEQSVYRLLQGPYANAESAQTAQQKLQKKGVVSIVRKA